MNLPELSADSFAVNRAKHSATGDHKPEESKMRTFVWAAVLLNCSCMVAAQAANLGAAGAAPAGPRASTAAPARLPLPDLAFSLITAQGTMYHVSGAPQSIIVYEAPTPVRREPNGPRASECNRTLTFPLQITVTNVGQADFITKGSAQAVGVSVGPWNSAKDLVNLPRGTSQAMNFSVTLAPGRYTLQATIDLHNQVAESRSDNNNLSWPLEVKCGASATAPAFTGGPRMPGPGASSSGGAGVAVAPGAAPMQGRPGGIGIVRAQASEATKARLRGAGLDPGDPNLRGKLRARLRQASSSYVAAHPSAIRLAPSLPSGPAHVQSAGGGGGQLASPAGGSPGRNLARAPIATIRSIQPIFMELDYWGQPVWPPLSPTMDPNKPNGALGAYFALFSSPNDVPNPPKATLTYGPCGLPATATGMIVTGDSPNQGATAPQTKKHANGIWYYYVEIPRVGVGGSQQKVTVNADMGPVGSGSFTMTVLPWQATAKITLTIDASPPFLTSNPYGLAAKNGLFGSPGVARLDPGTNPTASTSGDDVVGLGVNLGTGWTVTSATITSAHSVLDAPNDSTPDNAYRGATITKQPSAGRLETGVHWHYGASESLSYTVEWGLAGPWGQRPLSTMPLSGSCDS